RRYVAVQILSNCPTRRSSDLGAGTRGSWLEVLRFGEVLPDQLRANHFVARNDQAAIGPVRKDTLADSGDNQRVQHAQHERHEELDRKSTRLNSSHQIISYAFF